MQAITLHDRKEIASFFHKNPAFHIYELGDLDDFFWNYTTWYGLRCHGTLEAIILFYTGQPLSVLLALSDKPGPLAELLEAIACWLPGRFYAHLSPGLERVLAVRYRLESWGGHYKMALLKNTGVMQFDDSRVTSLTETDVDEVLKLYQASYPDNWFDARMIETGQYFGITGEGRLLSVAGVHVYSKRYRVAALGNITTHPDYRGRGLGQAVTAKLCRSLSETVDHIGLNVKKDNQPAIALYEKLGFEIIGDYGEFMVSSRA